MITLVGHPVRRFVTTNDPNRQVLFLSIAEAVEVIRPQTMQKEAPSCPDSTDQPSDPEVGAC